MHPGNEYLFGSKDANSGVSPSVRVRLKTFEVPPVRDAAIIGRLAPIKRDVLLKTLGLMSSERFVGIDVSDETVGSIIVRRSLLRRLSWEAVQRMVFRSIKPFMAKTEILSLHLDVEVAVGDAL